MVKFVKKQSMMIAEMSVEILFRLLGKAKGYEPDEESKEFQSSFHGLTLV